MPNMLCVNKTGRSLPVYRCYGGDEQIGTIYNKEAFVYLPSVGGDGVFDTIYFMGSNGQLKYGQLHLTSDGDELGAEPCIEYPYDHDYIDGKEYKTFKFRRKANVYNKDATYWGAVAGGCRVAFLDDDYDNGDTHLDWKLIRYVERTDGQCIPIVEGVSTRSNYGYVDTGLSRGSNPNVISMYGSWL